MKKFDIMLWRIIGVFILLAALGACGMILYGLAEFAWDTVSPDQRRDVVAVNETTKEKEYFRLGDLYQIPGQSYTMSRLYQESRLGAKIASSSSYGGSRVRNYYFYDPELNKGHWLLASNTSLIERTQQLQKCIEAPVENPAADPFANKQKERATTAFAYTIINEDSNGDGELNDDDNSHIYLSNAEGMELTKVISDLRFILSIEQVSDELLLVSAQAEDGDYIYSVAIPTKTVKSKHKIEYIK